MNLPTNTPVSDECRKKFGALADAVSNHVAAEVEKATADIMDAERREQARLINERDQLRAQLATAQLEIRKRSEGSAQDSQTIHAAQADVRRLDWLEARRVQCGFDPGQPPIGFESNYGPEPGYPPCWSLGINNEQIAAEDTLRAAIDAAMKGATDHE